MIKFHSVLLAGLAAPLTFAALPLTAQAQGVMLAQVQQAPPPAIAPAVPPVPPPAAAVPATPPATPDEATNPNRRRDERGNRLPSTRMDGTRTDGTRTDGTRDSRRDSTRSGPDRGQRPGTGAPGPRQPVQAQPLAPNAPAAATAPAPAAAAPPAAPPAATAPAAPPAAALAAPAADPRARRLQDIRGSRTQSREGGRTVTREAGRTIIQEGGRTTIRRDENERLRGPVGGVGARDVEVQRRGQDTVTTVVRPDGSRIVTVVDEEGRLLRRSRMQNGGRETVMIDNARDRSPRGARPFVTLRPPRHTIPRDRYIVGAAAATAAIIFQTLEAPPVETVERAYGLDEIRYSASLRDRMRRIDIDTITFASGSWDVAPAQAAALENVAAGMRRVIERNPAEVFLVEGHTDAVGGTIDNLSLSDRRAESVAIVLSDRFGVPPENLTTQGYGEELLKVQTQSASRENRRVAIRRITPLLAGRE